MRSGAARTGEHENVHDRQQVLDQLLLWRQGLLVGDHDIAAVTGGDVLEVVEPEPGQPVLVRDDERGDSPRSIRSMTARNFARRRFIPPPTSLTHSSTASPRARQNRSIGGDLRGEVVLLAGGRHAAVHDRLASSLVKAWLEHPPHVDVIEVPLPRGCSPGRDPPLSLPPAHGAHRTADTPSELTDPAHAIHNEQIQTGMDRSFW